MKKKGLSSYQRMKQKREATIQELTNDIITLVEDKDFIAVSRVRAKWIIKLDTEKAIWIGEFNPTD